MLTSLLPRPIVSGRILRWPHRACRCAAVVLGLGMSSGCAAPASERPLSVAASEPAPNRAEVRYVRQTAATLYRGSPMERTASFLPATGDGYRLCVRARRGNGYDHTLFTLQRRLQEDFIPQAADDILVERSRDATAPCRSDGNAWISLR